MTLPILWSIRSPYGVLAIDNNSEVAGIIEKPEVHHCISGGVYALNGTALDYIPDRQFFTVPDHVKAQASTQ